MGKEKVKAQAKDDGEGKARTPAILIHPDGRLEQVHPKGPKASFTLEELRELVSGKTGAEAQSCTVQMVRGAGRLNSLVKTLGWVVFVCDEDGKMKGLEPNDKATAEALLSRAIWPGDFMVGRVLVCTGRMAGY